MTKPIIFIVKYPGGVYKRLMKTTHKESLNRLARITGQINGIKRMIEEEKYCIDIITQIQAARSALRSLELQILEKHMHHCVNSSFEFGSSKDTNKKMEELLRVMRKQY